MPALIGWKPSIWTHSFDPQKTEKNVLYVYENMNSKFLFSPTSEISVTCKQSKTIISCLGK